MVKVIGTRQEFNTLEGWVRLHLHRCLNGPCSTREYELQSKILCALKPWMIRESNDLDGLKLLSRYLHGEIDFAWKVRFNQSFLFGGERPTVKGKSPHWVRLKIETHNRIQQIESGNPDRVRHGPADPAQMPDHALDRVIQTCKDMALVERCRNEKRKRVSR